LGQLIVEPREVLRTLGLFVQISENKPPLVGGLPLRTFFLRNPNVYELVKFLKDHAVGVVDMHVSVLDQGNFVARHQLELI
jgi:hypothetical protein